MMMEENFGDTLNQIERILVEEYGSQPHTLNQIDVDKIILM